jgi:hypothetical protein
VADFNLFLSTVAALSGTIAAILGGFVLAALLNVSSERNSLTELLRERRQVVEALEDDLALKTQEASQELTQLACHWLRLIYRRQDELPSATEVAARIRALVPKIWEHEAANLADWYLKERHTADQVMAMTISQISQDADLRSFAAWSAKFSSASANPEYLDDAFERAVASVERQLRLGGAGSSGSKPASDVALTGAESLASAELRLRNWSDSQSASEIARLELEVKRAKDYATDIQLRLSAKRLPSHLGLGLAVFLFNVAIGVIFPLSMMPEAAYKPTVLLAVKVSVVAQACAIVGYMIYIAANIRRAAG